MHFLNKNQEGGGADLELFLSELIIYLCNLAELNHVFEEHF